MRFENPANGYVEKANVPFLWCLLFGAFYFLVRGVWRHVFLGMMLSIITLGLAWFIYPFFARGIIAASYGRKGWIRLD